MKISIRYFAMLREQAARESEHREIADQLQAGQLYSLLRTQYGFQLSQDIVKVAINDEFCDWWQILRDGDTVVFIPPVAGG